jgi:hypothetical protein
MFKKTANSHKVFLFSYSIKYAWYCQLIILILFSGSVFAQSFRQLTGDYLGQTPPGLEATLFAPGIVSTDSIEHSSPIFSPDRNMVLWTRIFSGKPAFIVEMTKENGKWSSPFIPEFVDVRYDHFYPAFSFDGKKLYFSSRRPMPTGYPKNKDMWIWVVDRENNRWGIPRPLDSSIMQGFEYAHSVSKYDNIYFSSRRPGSKNFDLYFASLKNDIDKIAVPLDEEINLAGYEDGPFIAADESYLIFESERPESIESSIDLFICFRQKDGNWSKPKNMGPLINTKYAERFAVVSPDGKYLFFGSNRNQRKDNLYFDIFWIDAEVINTLRGD